MLSLDQLDDLEGRILKALDLIADLRDDNARLEQINQDIESDRTQYLGENKRLSQMHDDLRNQLSSKEKEINSIRQKLEETDREIIEIRGQERQLQEKIGGILTALEKVPKIRANTETKSKRPNKKAADTPSQPKVSHGSQTAEILPLESESESPAASETSSLQSEARPESMQTNLRQDDEESDDQVSKVSAPYPANASKNYEGESATSVIILDEFPHDSKLFDDNLERRKRKQVDTSGLQSLLDSGEEVGAEVQSRAGEKLPAHAGFAETKQEIAELLSDEGTADSAVHLDADEHFFDLNGDDEDFILSSDA